jgi:phosphosulfolactate phosphohydrolase-like enzyme
MAGAEPTDATRVAAALFDAWKSDLPGLLRRSRSGRHLAEAGLEKDLEFCARVDTVPVVAELDDQGILRAASR